MIKQINHHRVLAAMLLVGTALLIVANYCGVGLTYDSHLYTEAAEQIGNEGFLSAEGFYTKPPFYPLLIYWFGTGAIFTINTVCLLITLALLYCFGLTLKTTSLRLVFWALCLFSTGLYLVHSFAWTEPPFISVLLLSFYLIYQCQKQNKPVLLYVAVILLFLLPFIRFAGIFILMPTLFVLLLWLPIKAKKGVAVLAGVGIIVISYWVWQFEEGIAPHWNMLNAPSVNAQYARIIHNVTTYLETLSIWVLPALIYRPIRLFTGSVILVGIFLLAFPWKKQNDIRLYLPFIFLCYYALLNVTFQVEYYSSDPERYLTPLSYLLLLSFFIWLEQRFKVMTDSIKRGIWILLLALLTYNIARTAKNVWFWHQVRGTPCDVLKITKQVSTVVFLRRVPVFWAGFSMVKDDGNFRLCNEHPAGVTDGGVFCNLRAVHGWFGRYTWFL